MNMKTLMNTYTKPSNVLQQMQELKESEVAVNDLGELLINKPGFLQDTYAGLPTITPVIDILVACGHYDSSRVRASGTEYKILLNPQIRDFIACYSNQKYYSDLIQRRLMTAVAVAITYNTDGGIESLEFCYQNEN